MEAHETHEAIHEAHEGHHHPHHRHPNAKRVALLIAALAAMLAIVEMGAKSAQTNSTAANIEAANLWAFFQAKTIRMTTMRTAAEALETVAPPGLTPEQQAAWTSRATEWKANAQRYDSEPETGEGRKELAARAKAAEARRDTGLAAYHMFEYGAAALQLAIPLASAAVVTGMIALAWVAAGLGGIGMAFALLGWFAPTLVHL
jgi:hypothetical protein